MSNFIAFLQRSLLFLTCLNENSYHVTEKESQRWWRLWHLRRSWSRRTQLHCQTRHADQTPETLWK